jgi:hypothetical protein
MQILTRTMAVAVLAIGWQLSTIPDLAAQGQTPAPGPAAPSANVPDQKLDAVAAALAGVTSVQEDYRQRMAAASPSDQERITNEATNALKKAVTDQGISVEEYASIIDVAKKDPDVRQRLLARVRPPGQ